MPTEDIPHDQTQPSHEPPDSMSGSLAPPNVTLDQPVVSERTWREVLTKGRVAAGVLVGGLLLSGGLATQDSNNKHVEAPSVDSLAPTTSIETVTTSLEPEEQVEIVSTTSAPPETTTSLTAPSTTEKPPAPPKDFFEECERKNQGLEQKAKLAQQREKLEKSLVLIRDQDGNMFNGNLTQVGDGVVVTTARHSFDGKGLDYGQGDGQPHPKDVTDQISGNYQIVNPYKQDQVLADISAFVMSEGEFDLMILGLSNITAEFAERTPRSLEETRPEECSKVVIVSGAGNNNHFEPAFVEGYFIDQNTFGEGVFTELFVTRDPSADTYVSYGSSGAAIAWAGGSRGILHGSRLYDDSDPAAKLAFEETHGIKLGPGKIKIISIAQGLSPELASQANDIIKARESTS